jgi:5-formyltetrahydrofolate cyclo-ligase
MRSEPLPVELLDRLRRSGVRVIVPVTLADRDLDWMPWPGEASLGVDAIRDADVVLVPALAVAADGTRLGRGGGSYDRALCRARGDAERAAVVYDSEVHITLPRAGWDQPVTARVTPGAGWVALG